MTRSNGNEVSASAPPDPRGTTTGRALRKVRKLFADIGGARQTAPLKNQRFQWWTWCWVAMRGTDDAAAFVELQPSHTIYRHPPESVDGQVHWRFINRLQWQSPPLSVATIPDGRVWGAEGTVITPDEEMLVDVSMWTGLDPREHPFSRATLPGPLHIDGEVTTLAAPRGDSYFHWMFDVLPRLEILRLAGLTMEDRKLLINPLRYGYQEQALARLGIDRGQVVELSRSSYLRADRLVVPSFPGNTGEIPRWVCDYLRSAFLPASSAERSEGRRSRIYVARGNSPRRRITNEPELLDLLGRHGFDVVDPGKMSIEEQARVFAGAEVVVAPHGGALTNLVFASPGTRVIELFPREYVNVCYWSLANVVGLKYVYLLGVDGNEDLGRAGIARHTRPGMELHVRGSGNRDMTIDPRQLADALKRVGIS